MTATKDRGGRDGVRWWCALPDLDAAAPVADLLAAEADTMVAYGSSRLWLVSHGTSGELRTVVVGQTRVAVIGTCLASEAELRTHVEHAVQRGNYDALTALPGSYHLAVTSPDEMVVFGDVAGFRRICTCQVGGVTVVASHADVLRRLIDAPVSRTWLAARLACPEMPSPLRESLSPFDGVRAIPAGHRTTMDRTTMDRTTMGAYQRGRRPGAHRGRAGECSAVRRPGFHGGELPGRGRSPRSIGAAVGDDGVGLTRQR